MKKNLIVSACCLLACCMSYAQSLWTATTPPQPFNARSRTIDTLPANTRYYSLNADALRTRMLAARPLDATLSATADLQLPLADGGFLMADVYESAILSPALQAIIPDVKTYLLVDKATKNRLGRITVTANAITGLIFTDKGSVYINPVTESGNRVHAVYYTKEVQVPQGLRCGVTDEPGVTTNNSARALAGDCQLRTYRLAVAATGEYYAWAGSTVANALTYITMTVNAVNAVYERDATMHFTLVSNPSIIFTDAATDPYPTEDFPDLALNINDNTLDANLGTANYDIGIVFNHGWNGGRAGRPVACTNNKGAAAAGLEFGRGPNPVNGPQGPVFDGVVAHELGHTFNASHTMSADNGGCAGNTTASSAWETGGGSTIMAYAGTCTGNSYQNNTDLYFHIGSVTQISNYITTGAGSSCPVVTPLTNVAPVVSIAAAEYTIPISTPFALTCAATDANADNVTYTWEQLDAAVSSNPPAATATTGPNFRSYPATTNATRYFPRLQDVVNGVSPVYEVLPSVTRAMHFTVNVRDNAANAGCNAQQSVTVNTNAAGGPFRVTSQSAPVTLTANGTMTVPITWDIAGTAGAPFNTTNVDILFSADGGNNFNYTLLSATPNDGAQTIIVPNIPTSAGRIMVKAVGNIFYNINTANITILSSCGAEGATLSPAATVTASPGTAPLNLASAPTFGGPILPTSGASLEPTDPASSLAVLSSVSGSCINFGGNQYRYDTYPFQVNVAGTYTFTRTGGGTYVVNIHSGSFNAASPCTNFLASSGTYNGTNVNPALTVSAALIPGIPYTLTVGTFSATAPSPLPFDYTISLTNAPVGGNVFGGYPNLNSSFSYGYVIVNLTDGTIVDISATPDLRNTILYPVGNYIVYGFSYLTSHFPALVLDGYKGGPLTTLSNDLLNSPATRCGNLSKNNVPVNILVSLPVTLRPLTAIQEEKRVKLYWGTESESGSKEFEIERSADGKNFVTLHTKPAAGMSTTRINYTDYDDAPLADRNYYRVKAISQDGTYKYTNIAMVKKAGEGMQVNTYPNPVKDKLTVEMIAATNGKGTIEVVSANGRMVSRQSLSWQKGMTIETIDMMKLPAGVYYVRLISDTGVTTVKAVKL